MKTRISASGKASNASRSWAACSLMPLGYLFAQGVSFGCPYPQVAVYKGAPEAPTTRRISRVSYSE